MLAGVIRDLPPTSTTPPLPRRRPSGSLLSATQYSAFRLWTSSEHCRRLGRAAGGRATARVSEVEGEGARVGADQITLPWLATAFSFSSCQRPTVEGAASFEKVKDRLLLGQLLKLSCKTSVGRSIFATIAYRKRCASVIAVSHQFCISCVISNIFVFADSERLPIFNASFPSSKIGISPVS